MPPASLRSLVTTLLLVVLALPLAAQVPTTIRLRRGDHAVAPLPWQLPPVDVPEAGTTFVVELTPDRQRLLGQWIERIRALTPGSPTCARQLRRAQPS